eukprot:CAMPEP_0175517400 /NCGR_PEP_ID=MMETSP0096-20121207/14942_1 /TAXON_ID=311494 /ORGANISM="Alexandrium monilatum, Strain CCMP3105" /LENGTH=76 /DNA_ID=CAMNT_0016819721 /DNA_START=204 /DNA_END=434 /DNA_ORIENTATION=+
MSTASGRPPMEVPRDDAKSGAHSHVSSAGSSGASTAWRGLSAEGLAQAVTACLPGPGRAIRISNKTARVAKWYSLP